MLDSQELKIVLSTLTQRRVWLLKTLDKGDADPKQKAEFTQALKLLDSSMQKLARSGPQAKPTATSKPRPTGALPPAKPKRVIEPSAAYALIAEDDAASSELLKGILEDIGITKIEIVTSGRAALYALQNCSPAYDIVLCDWEMPEMSGLEVRRAVKSLAKLRDTYYVMVTAMTEVTLIREAIALGISDYIAKPVDVDVLEKKIRVFLGGAKAAEPSKPKQAAPKA